MLSHSPWLTLFKMTSKCMPAVQHIFLFECCLNQFAKTQHLHSFAEATCPTLTSIIPESLLGAHIYIAVAQCAAGQHCHTVQTNLPMSTSLLYLQAIKSHTQSWHCLDNSDQQLPLNSCKLAAGLPMTNSLCCRLQTHGKLQNIYNLATVGKSCVS